MFSEALLVPVFAGQGSATINSQETRQQGLKDASTPSGSLLLSSVHLAFISELSTLSLLERMQIEIDIADFPAKESLLSPLDKYAYNPVISLILVFLVQILRYMTFVESNGLASSPYLDVLVGNIKHKAGILGFSSGLLTACVVGTSPNALAYINNTLEVFRLTLWTGVRTMQWRSRMQLGDPSLPWSAIIVGMSKAAVLNALAKNDCYNLLAITAVMSEDCVTVSGEPVHLKLFTDKVSANTHTSSIYTLYHSIQLDGTRNHVLSDVKRRGIRLPCLTDFLVPVRSTVTGLLLQSSSDMVGAIMDMILVEPVNWDLAVRQLSTAIASDMPICLVNVGPGSGLTRTVQKTLCANHTVAINDLTKPRTSESRPNDVAIVGMAVRVPGASTTEQLWKLLENGISTLSEVPLDRFNISDYTQPLDPTTTRHLHAHNGNFIDEVANFDHLFFNINPREAKSMDPQQRILLHTAFEALENSGYVAHSTPTSRPERIGCYIGASTNDYVQNVRNDIDVYTSTGTLQAFLAGRISHTLHLSGPSMVTDTACSSSAVSIYLGCRALITGDCDAVIVGGVNVITSPDMMIALDHGHFLSPTGQCKTFDASADGYSRGEGCGVFVLKKLRDAIAENDNILGIIRGVEVNQSGSAASITHPHSETQSTLFRQLLDKTGVNPHDVNVVEAHGTGTRAGDPVEIGSIRNVFARNRSASNPLHITSIKPNIGHLEAASGAASLAKIVLMLCYRRIPKLISLHTLNPAIIPLHVDNTVIDVEPCQWNPPVKNRPLIAVINNFGASGSNAAIVVEEYPFHSSPCIPNISLVFALSAKTENSLEEMRRRFISWLENSESNSTMSMLDIAYTMTARRPMYPHCIAVHASDRQDLIQKLTQESSSNHHPSEKSRIIFTFSGQGGQYFGMGKSLYHIYREFRRAVDECEDILLRTGFSSVLYIIAPQAGTSHDTSVSMHNLEQYQVATFVVEYALSQLWMFWGVRPSAVIGHSLGEYAALVVAGVLSLTSALKIVASRAILMRQKCQPMKTILLAVSMDAASVQNILHDCPYGSQLTIACFNSPKDVVLAGPSELVTRFKQLLAEIRGDIKTSLLSVPFGYHSSAMSPILDDLVSIARLEPIYAPRLPIASNVTGTVVLSGDNSVFDPLYFSRHCAGSVLFSQGVQSLAVHVGVNEPNVWIECGPHPTNLPMVKGCHSIHSDVVLLGSMRRQQDPVVTLATCLTRLYRVGNVDVQWRNIFSDFKPRCVTLPSYPLLPTPFWIPFQESTNFHHDVSDKIPTLANDTFHCLIQRPLISNGFTAIVETPIEHLAPLIHGHRLAGLPVLPASLYIEHLFQCIKKSVGLESADVYVTLNKLEFSTPLVFDEHVPHVIVTKVIGGQQGVFTVGSRAGDDTTPHATGTYQLHTSLDMPSRLLDTNEEISPSQKIFAEGDHLGLEVFSSRTLYEFVLSKVIAYSTEYRTIASVSVSHNRTEARAYVKMTSHDDKYFTGTIFIDSMLQLAGLMANLKGTTNDAYICFETGTVKVIPDVIYREGSYQIYCKEIRSDDESGTVSSAVHAVRAGTECVVASIYGIKFKKVRFDRLKRMLDQAFKKGPVPPSPKPLPRNRRPRASTVATAETMATVWSPLFQSRNDDIIPLMSALLPSVSPLAPALGSPFHARTNVYYPSVNFGRSAIYHAISSTCNIPFEEFDDKISLRNLRIDFTTFKNICRQFENSILLTNNLRTRFFHYNTVGDMVGDILSIANNMVDGSFDSTSGGSSPNTLVTDERQLMTIDESLSIKQILSGVLDADVEDICDDADFASLGLDSLACKEAIDILRSEHSGLHFPADFLMHFTTCRAVSEYIYPVCGPKNTNSTLW